MHGIRIILLDTPMQDKAVGHYRPIVCNEVVNCVDHE